MSFYWFSSTFFTKSSLVCNNKNFKYGYDFISGKYPWQGSLEQNGLHNCGCVYLGGNTVLTAAHCTYGRPLYV